MDALHMSFNAVSETDLATPGNLRLRYHTPPLPLPVGTAERAYALDKKSPPPGGIIVRGVAPQGAPGVVTL